MLGSQGEGLWIVLMNSPTQTYQVMINTFFFFFFLLGCCF